jgi:hypothetical protein
MAVQRVLRGATKQLHVVDLGGSHGLFDSALNHDVAGPTLVQKSGFLDGGPVRNPCQNRPLLALTGCHLSCPI